MLVVVLVKALWRRFSLILEILRNHGKMFIISFHFICFKHIFLGLIDYTLLLKRSFLFFSNECLIFFFLWPTGSKTGFIYMHITVRYFTVLLPSFCPPPALCLQLQFFKRNFAKDFHGRTPILTPILFLQAFLPPKLFSHPSTSYCEVLYTSVQSAGNVIIKKVLYLAQFFTFTVFIYLFDCSSNKNPKLFSTHPSSVIVWATATLQWQFIALNSNRFVNSVLICLWREKN